MVILFLGIATLLSVFHGIEAQERLPVVEKGAQGISSPREANTKLEQAVKSMLRKDKELRKTNLKIEADLTKNEVTLSGTVDSEAMRDKAVELAKTAQVGVVVNNRISVKQGTTQRSGKN
jgi:osmotically-inducible protein OsmY